jgi:peptidoglycan hydrolase CwlO-like protein
LTDCILQLCDFQIKKLKEERQKAENEIVRLEKKVADAAKGMQSRDQLIETLQDSCSRLKSEIEQITVIVCFMFMS